MLGKCSSGWWCKHITRLTSGYYGSCGETPLRCLIEEYFIHAFQLPVSNEDSKSSRRRHRRHFLKSFHWVKHLQDNLRSALGAQQFGGLGLFWGDTNEGEVPLPPLDHLLGGNHLQKLQWGPRKCPLDTFPVINQAFSFQMTSGQSYSSFEILKISPSDWPLLLKSSGLSNLLPSSKSLCWHRRKPLITWVTVVLRLNKLLIKLEKLSSRW